MRVNLSVAVIAMSDSQSTNPDFEEYKWDEKIQSWLLSSFFIGYVFTQVPAGKLAQRYGAKSMLAYSIGLCAILNILTPYAARFGDWKAVMVLRALEGLCQGFLFPSTHTLLSKWAPVEERGKLGTYCYTGMSSLYSFNCFHFSYLFIRAGSQVGTVIMTAISGILASSALGWPSIFYISGSAGVVWSILWFFYGSNSPADCPTISDEERTYIEKSLQQKRDDVSGHRELRLRNDIESTGTLLYSTGHGKSRPFYAMGKDFHLHVLPFTDDRSLCPQLGLLDATHENSQLHENCP